MATKPLKHVLVEATAKDFFANTPKPTASKLSKHLDKHVSFPTFCEEENGKFIVTVGKGKDKFPVKLSAPKVKPAPTKTDAVDKDSDDDDN